MDTDSNWQLLLGDCLVRLKELPDNSVDSLVTDPPAGISFMSADWDSNKGGSKEWINWLSQVMTEVRRVLKPGAHGFVWALPRTSHWTAMAIEWSGLEIRDCVTHLFGSGFPKSLDVSKAIDKAAGEQGALLGMKTHARSGGKDWAKRPGSNSAPRVESIHAPASAASAAWEGWGTALKPAAEFWWLARKPLTEKTVAANVLKWGTGGLNIEGCRVPGKLEGDPNRFAKTDGAEFVARFNIPPVVRNEGRFPANLILDETAAEMLDAQSGILKSGELKGYEIPGASRNGHLVGKAARIIEKSTASAGGASRFFYTAKPSNWERNAGLTDLPEGLARSAMVSCNGQGDQRLDGKPIAKRQNIHPTVKPFALMRYLITMITPPGGTVIDPFLGSGTTGAVAVACGFKFIGIEREEEYLEIARRRIADVRLQPEPTKE